MATASMTPTLLRCWRHRLHRSEAQLRKPRDPLGLTIWLSASASVEQYSGEHQALVHVPPLVYPPVRDHPFFGTTLHMYRWLLHVSDAKYDPSPNMSRSLLRKSNPFLTPGGTDGQAAFARRRSSLEPRRRRTAVRECAAAFNCSFRVRQECRRSMRAASKGLDVGIQQVSIECIVLDISHLSLYFYSELQQLPSLDALRSAR